MFWQRLVLLLLVSIFILPMAAGAQCIGDDGLFTGNCWQYIPCNLPPFPDMKTESLWIPWKDCQLNQVQKTTLRLPPPLPAACGIYTMMGVDLRLSTGLQLWDPSALWFLFYTRTWMETDTNTPGGDRYQVWRFLINAEVMPSRQLLERYPTHKPGMNYLVPPCIYHGKPAQPVHYFGYIDYALNCRTNEWSIAFGVNHMCDIFTHNFFCKYPMGGHPDWSYTVVAPSAFAPSSALPGISGIVRSEAFRMVRIPMLPLCESEQDVKYGAIQLLKRKCPCGPSSNPNAQFINHLTRASSVCNSSATSINPFNLFWGGSVQMSVGTFTGPGYPGKEELYFFVDPMIYKDGKVNVTRADLFYGVGTQHGWLPNLFRPAPGVQHPVSFVDMQNVLMLPNLFTFSGMAGLYVSDILIYLNTY